MRNLQGKVAPYDPDYAGTTGSGFNTNYHHTMGQYYSVNVRYSFK